MTTLTIVEITILITLALIGLTIYLCFFTVAQENYAVINSFGKYRRIMGAGFNFADIPLRLQAQRQNNKQGQKPDDGKKYERRSNRHENFLIIYLNLNLF